MKIRSVEILQNLFFSGDPEYNIKTLSKKYGVSERSIYNDIKEINTVLSDLGTELLYTDNAGSIKTSPSTDTKKLFDYLRNIDVYDYHLSAKERRQLLLIKLLSSTEPLTVQDLTNFFFVSRTTVYYDLNKLKEEIKKDHATISFSSDTGIYVLCDEECARHLIADILVHTIKQTENFTSFQQMLLDEISNHITLNEIIDIIHIAELTTSSRLTERAFIKICMNFFIIANRYANGKYLTQFDPSGKHTSEQTIEYKFASFVFKEIGIISIAEIQSMSDNLSLHQIFVENHSALILYTVAADFMYKISNAIGVTLFNESESFAFLVNHLKNMMNREVVNKEYVKPISIEKRSDFKERYIAIFDAVENNKHSLEEYFHYTFTEDDLFYITMHICAAYERTLVKKPKLNIVVIAPGSMATAQMLSAQIESRFNLTVQGTYDRSKIDKNFLKQIDFVVSTQKLNGLSIPSIIVSPILNIKDYEKLLYMINQIRCQTSQLTGMDSHTKNCLSAIVDPSRIQLNASADSWEDAIRMGGKLLLDQGVIQESYITAMINSLNEFGPYFAVMPHLVFAHSAPISGALSSGLSLVVFPEGVPFGLKEHDPIHLLFTVAEKDSKNYLDIFKKVISIAEKKDLWDLIIHATSPEEVYQLLIYS